MLLGIVGGVACGAAAAVAGLFILLAAVKFDPSKAKGLDETLRWFADTPGPVLLIAARSASCCSASTPSAKPAGTKLLNNQTRPRDDDRCAGRATDLVPGTGVHTRGPPAQHRERADPQSSERGPDPDPPPLRPAHRSPVGRSPRR
ncbi:hypothetical protein OG689_42520 [Kitasatospora sp. NBC_00240]|uniref:DUF1206 domain-containing protein n=1 Tax=Kitasatospora sp. NBC_00240 TaxID=2903567 RepID=UPI0022554259|nr:DUF1206 domain-containing protein [Kitasatospora sp. NBC_00240]MCX5215827.1 hypothetical protein [Kitasatospora sp. NBC_00240]